LINRLIARLLDSEPFISNPPVCIDIGASGALPVEWQSLAPHSVCVAFDADMREFRVEDSAQGQWKRLIKLNRLVTAMPSGEVEFFLTKSPFCSSSLRPDRAALEPWAFADLFEVQRTVALPAVSLPDVLQELGISRVDWFKADTQGTDLRLFASLPEEMIDRTIVADFEPGIIDAYHGEDKLSSVMSFMNARPFVLSDMRVEGTQRIGKRALSSLRPFERRLIHTLLKTSPCWAELSYLNSFASADASKRDRLLGWICSTIKEQHGHALGIAERGLDDFGESSFDECRRASLAQLRTRYPSMTAFALRRGLARLLRRV
jgi:hypothetical protein